MTFFGIDYSSISVMLSLVVALYILIKVSVAMIFKKSIDVFMPFFLMGISLCLSAGFIFYDFYDITTGVYLSTKFVLVLGTFYVIWRSTNDRG